MFGLIMGMSAMFMVGACIGIGMTALCSASREAENMEENLNMKNVQDILIKKLTDTAVIPTRGSSEAAGVDLYANISEEIKIKPHETKKDWNWSRNEAAKRNIWSYLCSKRISNEKRVKTC